MSQKFLFASVALLVFMNESEALNKLNFWHVMSSLYFFLGANKIEILVCFKYNIKTFESEQKQLQTLSCGAHSEGLTQLKCVLMHATINKKLSVVCYIYTRLCMGVFDG